MSEPRPPFPDRAVAAAAAMFAHLAARPGLLLATCFALNATLLPYAGLYHDAELYSAQVVQAGTGRFADDLFFKYGSQSQFTVFPDLLAVPVGWVGVEPVFFAAYVLFTVLRLWATQRLILRLFGPTPAAAAGLVAAAVLPGWWGATGAFGVGEFFFTARVPATAVAILALERAVAGRWVVSVGLTLGAGLIHPLIAAPVAGVLVGMAALGWAVTPGRRAVAGGAVVVGVAGWVALALTGGTLDPHWRAQGLARNPHLDPSRWWVIDDFRVALAVSCVAVTAALGPPARWRYGWAAVAVAVAGVVGELAAVNGSWAVGLQAQPIRGLWPLELVRLPAGFYLAGRLWAGGPARRLAAVGLVLGMTASPGWDSWFCWLMWGGAVGLGVMAARAGGTVDGGTFVRGAVVGTAGWAALWAVTAAAGAVGTLADHKLYRQISWPAVVLLFQTAVGPVTVVGTAFLATAAVARVVRGDAARTRAAVGVGVAATLGWFAIPFAGPVARTFDPRATDVAFVRTVLDRDREPARTPVVYWPGPRITQIWHELESNGYYHGQQLAGNLFQRATAVEGERRLRLVVSFEIERLRRDFGERAEYGGEAIGSLIDRPPPTADEFRTLTAQPDLDFVVLAADYGGAVATNGSVWVYDCRKDRSVARATP
ncbi:MAG: hypothetical protein U0871_26585 [Gemmataceae bacterium]